MNNVESAQHQSTLQDPTAPIKVRGNYKFIYTGTLLLIAVIVGLIIYFLSDSIKIPSLNNRYEKIYSELEDKNSEIRIAQTKVDQDKSLLLNSANNSEKLFIIESLLNNLENSRKILERRIELNEEILTIQLDEIISDQAKEVISQDTAAVKEIESEISQLKKQSVLIGYNLEVEKVDQCFAAINFAGENQDVISQIDSCLTLFSSQESYLFKAKTDKKIPADFVTNASDIYYATFRARWVASKELYASLSNSNAQQSEELRNKVSSLSSQLQLERAQSDSEIASQLQ